MIFYYISHTLFTYTLPKVYVESVFKLLKTYHYAPAGFSPWTNKKNHTIKKKKLYLLGYKKKIKYMVLTTTWSIQSHGITARFTCPLTTQDTISNQLRSATETYILSP